MSSLTVRFVGVLLVVSTLLFPAVAMAAPEATGQTVHVVQWGETLSVIAAQYGVTVEAIMAANGLEDPDYVYVGQKLVIPTSRGYNAPNMMQPSMPGYSGGKCTHYYTVQYGDTLSGIALQYGTTANALMQANNLQSDFIYEGQKLCLPTGGDTYPSSMPSEQHTYYTVRAGDTLAGIALRFGVSQTAIVQANNLSNASLIYVDQRLIIPGGQPMAPSTSRETMGMPSGPSTGDMQQRPSTGNMQQGPPTGSMQQGTAPQMQAPYGEQAPYGQQAPYGGMAPMEGTPSQSGSGQAPAMPPGYQSPSQTMPGMAPPAPPPEYQPSPATMKDGSVFSATEPMWTGSQIAHSADPDEITTLLVLVEEGNENLDVMIRSKDGFVARGVTGVYFEYSWLPNFAFRGIPGGEYEVWIESEPSKVVKAQVDPGWRATVDFKWKIVSPGPLVSPDGWIVEVVDNTSGIDPIGAFSILVVQTGAIGNKIRLKTPDGSFEAVCVTGTKPEHGQGACDFGGLNAGTYQVILDGTHAGVEIYLDGIGTARVEFRYAGNVAHARWDP